MVRALTLIALILVLSGSASAAAASLAGTARNDGATLIHRRAVLGRALTASTCLPIGFAAPAQASKFPQHVEDLDRAATSGDANAVQLAPPSPRAAL